MLISHIHRFIFIKTVKTAGTSVEGFLEPLCTPPGHVVQHHTPTLISSAGVVGRRGPKRSEPDFGYFNHMSAVELRERFTAFELYRRFTVVRDPYDRAVSFFHFRALQTQGGEGLSLEATLALLARGDSQQLQRQFADFVQYQGVPQEQHRLCIDGQLAVQRWLRYESLSSDLAALARDWQLPLPTDSAAVANNLPRFKMIRHRAEQTSPPLENYLSAEVVATINICCCFSFDHFGYRRREPEAFPTLKN